MISAKNAARLVKLRTFKTNSHQLANRLKLKTKDAQNILFFEIVNNRCKNMNDSEFEAALDSDDKHFLWLITYAKRDVISKHFKSEANQLKVEQQFKTSLDDHYLINLEKHADALNDVEKEKIIRLLPEIFSHKSTVEFATNILRLGKVRTTEEMNLTDRQFNKKLIYIENYCDKNRQELINIVLSKQEAQYLRQERILKKFVDLLDDINYSDDGMQSLIYMYQAYIDDLIGTIPNVPRPIRLLENFKYASQESKYKLINKIYSEYYFVQHQLNDRLY